MLLLSNSNLPIEYVKSQEVRDPSLNTNFAVSHARTDLIHILHQDDWIISSDYYREIYDALILGNHDWSLAKGLTDKKLNIPTFNPALVFGFNTIGGPSALCIKREMWIPLNHNFRLLPDVVQFSQLYFQLGEPYITENVCIEYGTGLNKLTNRITNDEIKIDISNLFLYKYVGNFPYFTFQIQKKFWGKYLKTISKYVTLERRAKLKVRFQALLVYATCSTYLELIKLKKFISFLIPKSRKHKNL